MAFKDTFHEIVPGYRINGTSVVFAIMSKKVGGLGSGELMLEIGNNGVGDFVLIETADPASWPDSDSYYPVEDIKAVYDQLVLAGLSTVIETPDISILVNPMNVGLLQYDADRLTAESTGDGGRFDFVRSNGQVWQRQNRLFVIPSADFDEFKTLALQRLSTVLDVAGQAANAYIHFDGSNDYVEFTGTASGLLDWSANWTVGVNLVEFEVKSDGKFITLFSSGQNAIMLRRGGSNHGLYLTGNDGANKAGVNTWHAPNPGGKLLFVNDGTAGFLKYYIGNVDGTFALRGVVTIASATGGNNNPGSNFCIGKRVGSNAVAESLNYAGGLNNFIYADEAFANASPMITEYFGVNNTYDEASFYPDLNSWVKMGEDTYPNVVDTLGALTGGALIDGTEEDFVEITSP